MTPTYEPWRADGWRGRIDASTDLDPIACLASAAGAEAGDRNDPFQAFEGE